jgi:hypothetical protein
METNPLTSLCFLTNTPDIQFRGSLNNINGQETTCGFRNITLNLDGTDWCLPTIENTLPVAVPLDRPPRDYVPGMAPEIIESSHCFQLAAQIGEILSRR